MARVRISTTVDQGLLDDARKRRAPSSDEAYAAAYELHPVDEPDEWGDLASFCAAVSP